MRRPRVIGVLILATAVLALVVVPHSIARTVSGAATQIPVPGPPTVGDCVTRPGTSPWNPQDSAPMVAGTRSYSYPRLEIGRCTGTRFGEVVDIIPHPVTPSITVSADGGISEINDPNLDSCQAAAWLYIGLRTGQPEAPTPMFTFWYPVPMTGTAVSMPSVRQQAMGQRWLACITYPEQDADGVMTDPPGPYDSRLQGALVTGVAGDELGSCLIGIDIIQADSTGCPDVHRSEVFGYASTGPQSVSRIELQRTCREVIAELTRLPDITASGDLAVQMEVTHNDATLITGVQVPAGSNAVCGVSSTARTLDGSLLAIGHNPIPWA